MASIIRNKDKLMVAISNSYSIRSSLKFLNLSPSGGNYDCIKKAIDDFGIDTSHFTGQGHLRGKNHNYRKRSLDEILVKGKLENTWRLKNRLLKEKIKDAKCENCELKIWLEKPIPLELHHVDGDRKNNNLENLELWCPNCHSTTDNYRGKKKRCRD